jgi:hypothetical protein
MRPIGPAVQEGYGVMIIVVESEVARTRGAYIA